MACLYCCDTMPAVEHLHMPIAEGQGRISYLAGTELRNHVRTRDGESLELDYHIKFCPICGRNLQATSELNPSISTSLHGWIPCSERLPTEEDADHLGFIIAHSADMNQSTVCAWHNILGDGVTTHWMAMPTPPAAQFPSLGVER